MTVDLTLVAVFDSAHVRFFDFKEAHGHLEPALTDVSTGLNHGRSNIEADGPARDHPLGTPHHSHEAEENPRQLEKHDFARAVAIALEAALDQHKFSRLVVVAPARSLGDFRSTASDKLKHTIWREIGKEFAKLSDSELHDHLVPLLRAPEK